MVLSKRIVGSGCNDGSRFENSAFRIHMNIIKFEGIICVQQHQVVRANIHAMTRGLFLITSKLIK